MTNIEMFNRLLATEARLERQTTILERLATAVNLQAELIIAQHTVALALQHQIDDFRADVAKAREWADRVNQNIGNIDARVGALEGL